ncbi:phospho-sugar mutase [Enterococcus sp. AZ126]|uniref:phospho-sugar mutase n=1 Tax=Enterococcus sp. AZ126 TaxID=2774635 RepID=UPI003F20DD9E
MSWKKKYAEWSNAECLSDELKKELANIENQQELEDRFYQYLSFGTGGMRGEIGVGTNRINEYTIKRAALGLAQYIEKKGIEAQKAGVVISYDNRFFSKEFAQWTATVLASKEITVYLSSMMRPTPELSFFVRELNAFAGVMITASHNPKEYNGFKVYGSDGGQITLETATELMHILNSLTNELEIDPFSLSDCLKMGRIHYLDEEMDSLYLEKLTSVLQNKKNVKQNGDEVSILYTPLHGSGEKLIRKGFENVGFSDLSILASQSDGDPAFSTVKSPNPEDPEAFELALKESEKKKIDLFLATDPDADRLGVVILDEKEQPVLLNGNQIGVLLLDFLIRHKKSEKENMSNYFIAKTIVTSDLGEKIAAQAGIETRTTLTGFKFIGEQIALSEEKKDKEFLFGYEESFGYLIKAFVRDKDAIQAAILMAELALECKQRGATVLAQLQAIYQEHGFYHETLESITFKGKRGQKEMETLIETLKQKNLQKIGSKKIKLQEDYSIGCKKNLVTGEIEALKLPQSNVLKYIFEDGSWVCIRPSGTEPKCKIYYSVHSETEAQSKKELDILQREVKQLLLQK